MKTKSCLKCLRILPLTSTYFHHAKKSKVGTQYFHSRCKTCRNIVNAERMSDPEIRRLDRLKRKQVAQLPENKAKRKVYREENQDSIRNSKRRCAQRRPDHYNHKSNTWRFNNPEQSSKIKRNSHYKKKYGIGLEDYTLMLNKQHGKCAICKGEPSGAFENLVVDHDHATGLVRGLLCQPCNIGLGGFKDSVGTCRSAVKYIKKYTSKG